MNEFADHPFKHHSSQKLARVSLAHVQGFIENLRHFSNRAVAHSRNSQYRPIVIHNGVRMDISDASALLCSVQAGTGAASSHEPRPQVQAAAQPAYPSERIPSRIHKTRPEPPAEPPPPPGLYRDEGFGPLQPLGAVAEDSALRFTEAKKGFEEALSMLLSSYPGQPSQQSYSQQFPQPFAHHGYPHQPYTHHTYPPQQACPHPPYSMYQRQESHEDDDRTQGAFAEQRVHHSAAAALLIIYN